MNILCLSPHTDDAEIGAGGSINHFLNEGHKIMFMVFSAAKVSKDFKEDSSREEFYDVMRYLGLDKSCYRFYNWGCRYLYLNRQVILDKLIKIRDSFKPSIVICPSLNDYHQDHQVISNECVRAFKKHSSIIGYEIPWNHVTFDTNLFIKLTKDDINKKYKMLSFYKSQFLDRNVVFTKEYIYGLGKVRGSQCNSDFAESFEVIRWIL